MKPSGTSSTVSLSSLVSVLPHLLYLVCVQEWSHDAAFLVVVDAVVFVGFALALGCRRPVVFSTAMILRRPVLVILTRGGV